MASVVPIATMPPMADWLSKDVRSKVMASILSKNTKPEIIIRSALHKAGFRFRLHDKALPGKPDITLPKYKAVIQINGCFWHAHNCDVGKIPASKQEYWKPKLARTKQREEANRQKLNELGYTVLTIWECALVRKNKLPLDMLISDIAAWITSKAGNAEIRGK